MDAAISVCLKSKNYDKAGAMIRTTKVSPKIYLEYARAREATGAFREAVVAYEAAKAWTTVVRLVPLLYVLHRNWAMGRVPRGVFIDYLFSVRVTFL